MLGEFVNDKARNRYFATYDALLEKWPVPARELEPAGFGLIGKRFVWWSMTEIFRWFLPLPLLRLVAAGDPVVRRSFRPLLLRGLKYRMQPVPQHLFTDDELRSITVPTRIVLGERSVIHDSREVLVRLKKLNPNISSEVVPKTGHGLSLEKAELITARILAFGLTRETDAGPQGGSL
ncbi:hypothetical protein SAMN05421504_11199 [Amycolatopsis xylanica]|uniref:Alpha/beta hydrolase family protein n=1 Tax=Amycolatopsis xylanica TaxID=589385 RepID=A0A1H3RI73_9PSEU|nr:alpha/beta hydrolase [Amycolatopsis xylanica]SDZ25283.1 hypothetical protein SAMN05421504_11199 [Amycolatopsis xylanica]